MDKDTLRLVVSKMGGYITRTGGQASVSGLPSRDQDILDILEVDLCQIELDDEIKRAIGDKAVSDDKLRSMLDQSESWSVILNQDEGVPFLVFAKFIEENLREQPGAVLFENTKDWELWIKTGPE